MATICGPRGKKQHKNVQNIFREAAIMGECQNIHDKNTNTQLIVKKDRMSLKKKNKFEEENKYEVSTAPDKQPSDLSEQSNKQSPLPPANPNILVRSSSQSTLPLDKMIHKISILQVQDSKIVNGCYGHTTVVFKRPIIQGKYYLEFKMLKSNLGQGKAKIKYPPAIRLGICPPQYPNNTPLGQDISVGYKGSNGKFVSNAIEYEGQEPIKQGDVIGLCMSFSPPHKYQNKELLWQESQISIQKNGIRQGKWDKIYQCFYCPAFSLYNYASIQVRVDESRCQYCPEGYKCYLSIFSQAIKYQPLKNTALFGQFKFEQN